MHTNEWRYAKHGMFWVMGSVWNIFRYKLVKKLLFGEFRFEAECGEWVGGRRYFRLRADGRLMDGHFNNKKFKENCNMFFIAFGKNIRSQNNSENSQRFK